MLRKFTQQHLDVVVAQRGEAYKAELLTLAVKESDGLYVIDTEKPEVRAFVAKYTSQTKQPVPPPTAPAPIAAPAATLPPGAPAKALPPPPSPPVQATVVTGEMVLAALSELTTIAGTSCPYFDRTVAEYKKREAAGGCKGCRRGLELERLKWALRVLLMQADVPGRQAIRALFPKTEFLESMPVPVKWSDVLPPAP